MKKTLMYNKNNIGKDISKLTHFLWERKYQTSQSTNLRRYSESSSYPIRLVPLDYKGIKFNMITCPAGDKVKIDNWGEQEIKKPFMLGETEITQELFESVMEFNPSSFKKSIKNPVEGISWFDCLDFCNRLSAYFELKPCYKFNYISCLNSNMPLSISFAHFDFIEDANGFRLPKEWEWQIAAKAGTKNQYSGARDFQLVKKVAWFKGNSGKESHPVAQKLPNEWGFYDMSGNVSEWCENTESPNEHNDPSAQNRAVRGGGWDGDSPSWNSAECVYQRTTSFSGLQFTGFRIAKTI